MWICTFSWWAGMGEADVRSGPPIPRVDYGDIIPTPGSWFPFLWLHQGRKLGW